LASLLAEESLFRPLVNEHLPQIAGQAMVSNVLSNGNEFYDPPGGDAFMPIEFGAGPGRLGTGEGDLEGLGVPGSQACACSPARDNTGKCQ
jgi:hypothetical protein